MTEPDGDGIDPVFNDYEREVPLYGAPSAVRSICSIRATVLADKW